MLPERLPVAREGYPFIGYCGFVTIVFGLLEFELLAVFGLLVTSFVLAFFRDPERFSPEDPDAVLAPADGKVIIAQKVYDERFSTHEMNKVSIFMNIFNVHVNRVPVSGTVIRVQHVPGKFLAADNDAAHLKNEYCAIHLETRQHVPITFVQIAGLIARRIVCRLEPGDQVTRAERFGLIRFGSRVDIYLPITCELDVAVGQKVRAGETILARLPDVETC